MEKTALYISTFQPVHLGHVEDVRHIISQGINNVILGIGSSKQHHLFNHPFTLAERKKMIGMMMEKELKDALSATPYLHEIPDTWDIDETHAYIMDNLPAFDVIVSRNKGILNMCKKYGIPTIQTPRLGKIRSNPIRHQITLDNQSYLSKGLSPEIVQYIHRIDGKGRLQQSAQDERIQPMLAVDIVEMDDDGYVVMIERRDDPVGLAFPGGMIEYGHTVAGTAAKEAMEEITQKIEVINIGQAIDNPLRDPRGHTITFPVRVRGDGGPIIANDDAADAFNIHITDLINRKHEVVLGGEKIIEQLHDERQSKQS